MNLREIRPTDIDEITLQTQQAYMRKLINDQYKETVTRSAVGFTLEDDGLVIGCGGIIPFWQGRGEAWTLLSNAAGPRMLTVTRIVRRVLNGVDFDRVQMTTDVGFPEAERWAQMLGFEYEGTMRSYFPDGRSAKLWARVR